MNWAYVEDRFASGIIVKKLHKTSFAKKAVGLMFFLFFKVEKIQRS